MKGATAKFANTFLVLRKEKVSKLNGYCAQGGFKSYKSEFFVSKFGRVLRNVIQNRAAFIEILQAWSHAFQE